ncbi:class I SAM-dependent methyltransferase [Nitratireductor thuwali]|uniref:Demethylrebeccamycin-D-glucose O-methyltransferase n=1 Tax=Nitratireductor thuwali TaxID=2267699 RepID=A0ABY5MED8_9HYPH|nr:Demethylrebeccamycin-D-glucose O-methyltransferase [Nitratireductor thuwali]
MNDAHTLDYKDITARQKATWSTGDFHVVSRGIVGISEALCETVDPRPRERVLDIACGSGNTALAASRRYCEVTGIDYVPALIERARTRAEAEGAKIDFQVADAQDLPFPDGHFDVVVSVFGVMFAPDQEKAASELLRVTRPGGRIGLANWMPESFSKDFFGAHAKHNPPPPGAASPLRWGSDEGLEALLGAGADEIRGTRKTHRAYMRSIDHALEIFSTYFGPTRRALDAIGPEKGKELLGDLREVFERYDVSDDDTLVLEMPYLEVTARKR